MQFVRIGYADRGGAILEWSASAGFGCAVREHDYFGLGLDWGRPSSDTFGRRLDVQFSLGSSYR